MNVLFSCGGRSSLPGPQHDGRSSAEPGHAHPNRDVLAQSASIPRRVASMISRITDMFLFLAAPLPASTLVTK